MARCVVRTGFAGFQHAVVIVFYTLMAAFPAAAADIDFKIIRLPVTIDGSQLSLEAVVATPPGPGPFPVALLTHGSPPPDGTPEELSAESNFGEWSLNMASRGYLAVGIMRRGYGFSDGVPGTGGGDCAQPKPELRMQRDAADLAAALQAVALWPQADMSRVVAMGQSLGGAAVLALAARADVHLAAAVSISGGIYHRQGHEVPKAFHVYDQCPLYRKALVDAVGHLAASSPAPQLWIYAENDPWFRPDLVEDMRQVSATSGGKVEAQILPPSVINGHAVLFRPEGMAEILPVLDDFLRAHDLLTWKGDDYQGLRARLLPDQRKDLDTYLRQGVTQKALAVASNGNGHLHWIEGSTVLDRAERQAIETCEKDEKTACRLLMANFDPLPPAQTASADTP